MNIDYLRYVALLLLTLVLLILTSALLYVCVHFLADTELSIGVTALYILVLCGAFHFSRMDMIPLGSLLFTASIVLALVVNARTPPITVHIVAGWLKHDVRSGVGRQAVTAFIAKHRDVSHTILSFDEGTKRAVVVDYINHEIFTCPPNPEIIFVFDKTNHLVRYEVGGRQSCTWP